MGNGGDRWGALGDFLLLRLLRGRFATPARRCWPPTPGLRPTSREEGTERGRVQQEPSLNDAALVCRGN
jgi:hypothetical protein